MLILYDCERIIKMLSSNQHSEPSGESRIDKMRKFLSSPLTRKKSSSVHFKTFGTPLEILLQRGPSDHSVPFIITRLCQYILKTGLSHEGLFRISGNARSVERLKASFDRSGDAPLETEGDVPSAAALLKLFLRELPDPIIPLAMHCQFLNAVKDKDKAESVPSLIELVEKLPPVNYNILNYLFSFLRKVSDMEDQNRMSASSLGIVFGPNLFRVTEDFVGLKEQSLTNQIVMYFISEHEKIFRKEDGYTCSTCYSSAINKPNQVATMVSSWPETKGCSTSMMSTWSLGPLSVQNVTSDDYLSLGSLSHSLVQTDSGFISLKCPDQSLVSESLKLHHKDFSEYSLNMDDLTYESNATENSPMKSCVERKGSLGKESLKEYYIMEEEPMLSYSSLSDKVHVSTYHSSIHQEKSKTSNEIALPSSSRGLHAEGSSDTHSPTMSNFGPKLKVSHDETEELLKDTHKIYPRGRRRHAHSHKNKSDEVERRSQSELRTTSSRFQIEDEFNGNSSTTLSFYGKGDMLHSSTGTLEESGADTRHSWPAFRKCKEEEDIALSPLPQQLGVNTCDEASVSPSAFRSYLSHRNLHLDPSLPPSPPVEQEDIITGGAHEVSSSSAKQITKKMHALRKKIKLFEDNFEKLYGYKPSHTDKCSNIAVKKMLTELNKARQDLKDLKDDPLLWDTDDSMPTKSNRGTNTRSSQGLFSLSKNSIGNVSIEDAFKDAMAYLDKLRIDAQRPENLEEMTKEQLVAEKVAIQKVLLNFESMHGRPAIKAHKELVRPLYDRYRSTKRLISRNSSTKEKADLMPILEHETMDFRKMSDAVNINVDTKSLRKLKSECSVTEDDQDDTASLSTHINFHELSVPELEAEMSAAREEKRKFRTILREFEERFKKEHGRRVQREDKRVMESCYTEYKNAKGKLKLLEALVAKSEQTS